MSRYLNFASVVLLLLMASCQKETSFEVGELSQGTLLDSSGDCLSKTVSGSYNAGKALNDSNYIDVTVAVSKTGRYTIYTDTVNGYYFKATGNFSSAGSATVRLVGFGTPAAAGINDFSVFYDSSFCNVSITVLPGGSSSGGTAVLSLNGTGGNCMNDSLLGTYTQGIALGSSNKIEVEVNVTTPGTWIMGTNTVDGFSFYGSGTFTSTGVQKITLDGVGTPGVAGDQTFLVTAGASSCSFVVTVQPGSSGGTTGSSDYFPLTQNSYWTYDDAGNSDTLKTTVTGSATLGGKSYQRFVSVYGSGTPNDTAYFRKDNSTGSYYEYIDPAFLVTGGLTVSEAGLDVLFLKNALTTGSTWNSDFNETLSGMPVVLRFKFTCTNANASLTVNGKSFSNVYQINAAIQLGTAGVFADVSPALNFYYAKGIGLIKIADPTNGDHLIRNWQVL